MTASSIPSNIAEGQARNTVRFGLHFIRIALGSAAELDTHVELAKRLKYVTEPEARELAGLLERVVKMLYGMQREHRQRLAGTGAAVMSILLLLRVCALVVALPL